MKDESHGSTESPCHEIITERELKWEDIARRDDEGYLPDLSRSGRPKRALPGGTEVKYGDARYGFEMARRLDAKTSPRSAPSSGPRRR
jgi:hypothetical protein